MGRAKPEDVVAQERRLAVIAARLAEWRDPAAAVRVRAQSRALAGTADEAAADDWVERARDTDGWR